MEEWKEISGFPGYQVSSIGRLKSFRQTKEGKILSFNISPDGYCHTPPLAPNRNTISIHRLVALAFIPNPEDKPTVDHINRNRKDNRVENLRWAFMWEQARNTNDKKNASGEKYITQRFRVKITGKDEEGISMNFHKYYLTLEEAVEARNTYLLKLKTEPTV